MVFISGSLSVHISWPSVYTACVLELTVVKPDDHEKPFRWVTYKSKDYSVKTRERLKRALPLLGLYRKCAHFQGILIFLVNKRTFHTLIIDDRKNKTDMLSLYIGYLRPFFVLSVFI